MNSQVAQILTAVKDLLGERGRFSIEPESASPAPQAIGDGTTLRLGNQLVGTYESRSTELHVQFQPPFPQLTSQRWFGRISAPVNSITVETDGLHVELTGLPDQRIGY